jgi:hypothetical protein
MQLLEQNGIKAIAFKGPTLAQLAYGDIALRQYSDLDILIDEKEIYNSLKLLLSYNYKCDHPISLLENKKFRQLDNDFSLYTPNNIHIELHWRLFRKKIGKLENFQKYHSNILNIQLSNSKIPTLSLEYLLVYLCMHGSKHAWERIEWINDIHYLIINNYQAISWDKVIKISSTMQSKKFVLSSLNLVYTFYNTKLPHKIINLINTNTFDQLSKDACFFIQNTREENYNYYRKIMLFQTKLLDTKTKKIAYILNSYFSITANDYLTFPLPSHLNFLYYILKPLRIILKVVKRQQ